MTKDEAMKLAWEDEKKRNPHTAYNSWCRGYEAGLRQALEQPEREWFGFYPIERKNLAMAVMAQIQISGANMKGLENAILFIEEQLKEKNRD